MLRRDRRDLPRLPRDPVGRPDVDALRQRREDPRARPPEEDPRSLDEKPRKRYSLAPLWDEIELFSQMIFQTAAELNLPTTRARGFCQDFPTRRPPVTDSSRVENEQQVRDSDSEISDKLVLN